MRSEMKNQGTLLFANGLRKPKPRIFRSFSKILQILSHFNGEQQRFPERRIRKMGQYSQQFISLIT